MKKKIVLILSIIFLLCGCAKSTTTTKINLNKSIDFETEFLLSDKLDKDVLMEISQDKLAAGGFNISVISEGNYKGARISKRYSNIDKVSNAVGETVVISDVYKGDLKDNVLYKVEKSFFKNKYYGVFKYKLRSEMYYKTKDVKTELSEDSLMSLESESYYKYIVKLPYGSMYNNANEVTDNGKTLIWNLNKSEDTVIKYNFILYNVFNVAIVAFVGLVVIIFVAIVVIKLIKQAKKETKQSAPIHVDYDPSIEDKLNEFEEEKEKEAAPEVAQTDNNQINNGSFEFDLPTETKRKVVMKEVKEMQKPEKKDNKFIVDMPEIEALPDELLEEKKKELP